MSTLMKVGAREGGLCRNGLTLRDNRNEVVERTRESGHYNGLASLELKERDPIFFEKLASRIRAVLVDARETALPLANHCGQRRAGGRLVANQRTNTGRVP